MTKSANTASSHALTYKQNMGNLTESECICNLMFSKQFPKCKGKQPKDWDARYISSRENKYVADKMFWLHRAFAIYHVENDVGRLALNIGLANRSEWLNYSREGRKDTLSTWEMITALGINDQIYLEKLIKKSAFPKTYEPRWPYHSLIANAFQAGVKKCLSEMQAVIKERPRQAPFLDVELGIWNSFVAIAESDPVQLRSGIQKLVETDRPKKGYYPRINGVGMLALANRINPTVLEEFDWKGLPKWYRALSEWAKTNSPDFFSVDCSSTSIDLQKVWLQLAVPFWVGKEPKFKRFKEPSIDFDLSARSFDAIEDHNRLRMAAREEEFFDLFCQCTGLPLNPMKYAGQLMPNLVEFEKNCSMREKCRSFKSGRRFENEVDYYLVNTIGAFVTIYRGKIGIPGRDETSHMDSPQAAKKVAEDKIAWLMEHGFGEVPLTTAEPDHRLNEDEPIVIALTDEDEKDFDRRFFKNLKDTAAAREKVKRARPKATLKPTKPTPKKKKKKKDD